MANVPPYAGRVGMAGGLLVGSTEADQQLAHLLCLRHLCQRRQQLAANAFHRKRRRQPALRRDEVFHEGLHSVTR